MSSNTQPPARTWYDHLNLVLMMILAAGSMTSAGLSCRSSQIAADSLAETQRVNKEQQNRTNEQLGNLRTSMRQQTASTVYAMGLDTSRLLIQYPHLRDYFEEVPNYFKSKALPRKDRPRRTLAERQQEWARQRDAIMAKFDKEPLERQAQVWAYAEYLASFMEFAYVHRELLDAKDWAGWWNYICDEYDSCPVLREYCRVRGGADGEEWYRFVNDVQKPDVEREKVALLGSK